MDSLEMMPVRVRITAILRKAIFAREYKSGDELSLTDIAERLGVSRTPVREAFQTLEADGLITLRMNKGAVVNRIDRKCVKDCFEMRILLESEAAARAAAAGMQTDGLLAGQERLRQNLDSIDRAEYEALNQEVHMAIWSAADNAKLRSCLLDLWNGPSTRHSLPEASLHYKNSTLEHIAILGFIRDKNAEEARMAMHRHITRSMENILAYYEE